MRLAFAARQGFVLISADYSQMEMRVLAHMCGDPGMLQLFRSMRGDIYRDLACRLFNKHTPADVTDMERTQAKTICLGVVYGMGNEAAAAQLKVDVNTVRKITDSFFQLFPQMKNWVQNIKTQTKQFGMIRTLLGRVRHLPDINSNDSSKSSTAARQAVNSVIQGTASDIMKSAMIAVDHNVSQKWSEFMEKRTKDCFRMPKLLMQIHDELIYEVPIVSVEEDPLNGYWKDFVDILHQSLEQEMEEKLKFRVPFMVNIKIGLKWGEMESRN